jgi:hypothetical protein
VDAYHTLAYLALEDVGPDEHEFRSRLLELHDSDRRLQIAQKIYSGSSVIETLQAQIVQRREALKECQFFSSLPEKERNELLKKPPDFHQTRAKRNSASHVDDDFYLSVSIYLSQFVHTHGFAIHHLTTFAVRTSESYRAMIVPITFAMAFMARAIQGMNRLFSVNEDYLSPQEKASIDEYSLMANGFPVE